MQLIDVGANLTHDSFDADREAVIRRALDAGVERMIVTGSTVETSRAGAALAAHWPGRLYATAGVHPHHASEYAEGTTAELERLARDAVVVAVGECGLDHYRNFSPPDAQARAFDAQLALAGRLGMPVFLHQREAHAPFLEVLDRHLDQLPAAVAHCFTGTADELRDYLARGLYIGITGWICDERRGRHLLELAGDIPPERLMIETDAPYLLPRSLRPKPKTRRNEPRWLPAVLETVAAARGESPATLARITTANAERFFRLPPLADAPSAAETPAPSRSG